MKNTNIKVYISIFWDTFNIEELTKILWITPTESYYKWDKSLIFKTAPIRKETCWEYSTLSIETYELDKVFIIIVNTFKKKIDLINKFVKENNLFVKLFIVPIIENWITPTLYFNREIIDFAYNLNAEIDIDMYVN